MFRHQEEDCVEEYWEVFFLRWVPPVWALLCRSTVTFRKVSFLTRNPDRESFPSVILAQLLLTFAFSSNKRFLLNYHAKSIYVICFILYLELLVTPGLKFWYVVLRDCVCWWQNLSSSAQSYLIFPIFLISQGALSWDSVRLCEDTSF